MFVLSNAIGSCSEEYVLKLLENGVLDCFIELLDSTDEKILPPVLSGIEEFVSLDNEVFDEDKVIEIKKKIEDKGVVEKIKELKNHENKEISEMATFIIEAFFEKENN